MSDDTYVHDPSEWEGDERDEGEAPEGIVAEAPPAEERDFDWRGWLLVGWLVIAFLVVPGYLFFYPYAGDALSVLGLGFRDTYLFFPLIPAIVLGALAVWATTRP